MWECVVVFFSVEGHFVPSATAQPATKKKEEEKKFKKRKDKTLSRFHETCPECGNDPHIPHSLPPVAICPQTQHTLPIMHWAVRKGVDETVLHIPPLRTKLSSLSAHEACVHGSRPSRPSETLTRPRTGIPQDQCPSRGL